MPAPSDIEDVELPQPEEETEEEGPVRPARRTPPASRLGTARRAASRILRRLTGRNRQ
jgi:hypothetical protein